MGEGRIAQLGERRPYKPEVAGSIPVPPTIRFVENKTSFELRVMSYEFKKFNLILRRRQTPGFRPGNVEGLIVSKHTQNFELITLNQKDRGRSSAG